MVANVKLGKDMRKLLIIEGHKLLEKTGPTFSHINALPRKGELSRVPQTIEMRP